MCYVCILPSSRTLWGTGYGGCTTCYDSITSEWSCPAALSTYYDIGGSDANIIETDGATGMNA